MVGKSHVSRKRSGQSTKNASEKTSGSSSGRTSKDVEKPLDWREILNEEATWHDYGDFSAWFSQVAGRLPVPEKMRYEKFCSELDFIREQASLIYFDQKPDVISINKQLKLYSLEIDAEATSETRLPSLLAVARPGDQILDRLYGSLLVGFAQFVADNQNGGPGLCRCEGVFRDARMSDVPLTEPEKRYRQEISLLEEKSLLDDAGIQRCADFFVGRSKARFCSDTCRFMTFQISKQLKDPRYLAEKQRRYRSKQRDSLE